MPSETCGTAFITAPRSGFPAPLYLELRSYSSSSFDVARPLDHGELSEVWDRIRRWRPATLRGAARVITKSGI